jgi:hypothetical protein
MSPRALACLPRALRPEIELSSRLVEVDGGGPYRGHDCLRSWWQNLLGTSPDFSGEIEGVLEPGDVTVVRLRLRGHGVGSDASMKHTSWFVTEAQSQGHLVGRVPERGRGS